MQNEFSSCCFAKVISLQRNPSYKRKTVHLSVLGSDLEQETSVWGSSIQLSLLGLWSVDCSKLWRSYEKKKGHCILVRGFILIAVYSQEYLKDASIQLGECCLSAHVISN